MDKDTRICIVGAGAAGITAALTLKAKGYRRITIIEKESDHLGGKCHTLVTEDGPIDVGALYVLPNYPLVRKLAKQARVTLYRSPHHEHRGTDGSLRPYGQPPSPFPTQEKAMVYAKLGYQAWCKYRDTAGPVGDISQRSLDDLSLPYSEWIDKHQLAYFHEVAYPILRIFGFGHEEDCVPALYILRTIAYLAPHGNLLALWDLTKSGVLQIEEGIGGLWERLALPFDIHRGAEVSGIERHANGGVAFTREREFPFDHLIIATPADSAVKFMDSTDEEKELFGSIKWLRIWQAAAQVEGLPTAMINDAYCSKAASGRTVGWFGYRRDVQWGYFFGYVGDNTVEQLTHKLEEDIRDTGGNLLGPIRLKCWNYFPHYNSNDLAAGYHRRVEGLQGQRSTFYTGESIDPFGIERAARHAQDLVRKYF